MVQWLIASNNPYKTADLQNCLAQAGIEAIGYTELFAQVDFPVEGINSYRENAHQKAQFLANYLKQPVIADDSGLELVAFHNRFGVQTSRQVKQQAKQAKISDNAAILATLTPEMQRDATMITELVAIVPGQSPIYGHGQIDGEIVLVPRGTQSTGFDKIFQPTGYHQTLAEMPTEVRLPLTHRGRAALDLYHNLLNK